jgi:glutamate-5-semialdehyde dehydrogenase
VDAKKAIKDITSKAREAALQLAVTQTEAKDRALFAMADAIDAARTEIKKANAGDVEEARKGGKSSAFLDRLALNDKRIDGMSSMLREVAALKDPVGLVMEKTTRPNGLVIEKVRVPIGVIGIVYEARPNVTADCVALCLKSGNAVILRGGSDAIRSNKAVYEAMRKAASASGLHEGAFILVEDTSRELVDAMLEASGDIDLIMPRGGESLIREVVAKSRIPVIKHYKGVCHVYVDSDADLAMAEAICMNAKVQRPGVCNAMETMLVHEAVAEKFLVSIGAKRWASGVKIKGCPVTKKILGTEVEPATEEDYSTEWSDLILNVRVVKSLDEAIRHIARYGSGHSDAIVTNNGAKGIEFTMRVDSSAVYVNASTRFTDGGEFGKGAEIGISTDKLHARGPMGLEELTSYKYVVHGSGQVRM